MEVQIREYRSTDKEKCLEAFKSNVPYFFTREEVGDFITFLDSLTNRSRENTRFFVQEVDNTLVGCGGFGDKDGNGIITLAWGLVHKDFHKKGLGELLLKFRLQRINQIYPLQPVYIDTTQFSYGFFEKFGFAVTKISYDFYAEGMHRYDMVFENKN